MKKSLAAYLAALSVMLALDLPWLGWVAKPLYAEGLGPLLAESPRLGAAALFYLLYPLGLVLLAVRPHAATRGWRPALLSAACFGFFAYATYDLTNLATLRGWPLGLSVVDMAWGTLLSAAAGAVAKLAFDRA